MVTPTTRSKKNSSGTDRVTAYARAVAAGRIIAGPHVRAAAARHLKDLKEGKARGIRFDRAKAARAIRFFESVLRLAGGEFEGVPFLLLGWQAFIVGALFGWVREDGTRRFRVAYIETGKGSGKSPLAAGIGLYGLTSDGEPRAEIYAAATKKEQAAILFRDAVAAVRQSPLLRKRLKFSGAPGNEWNIANPESSGFFRPVATEGGQSGPRVHMGLIDEVHEHRTNTAVEMMRAGTKKLRQSLILMITNSGADRTSVCWEYHDYSTKVAAGALDDDSFFAFVCGLDRGDERKGIPPDDPLNDESCWPKANPSLQEADLPGLRYLRDQVTQARGMPSKESIVRRLNFCQWTDAADPWIASITWDAAAQDYDADDLVGRRAFGGLDLSSTTDLTAFVLAVEPLAPAEPWRLLAWFWLPEEGLPDKADRDRVPYVTWRDRGFLQTTPGAAIDKAFVAQFVAGVCAKFKVQSIGFDRWRIEDFKQAVTNQGVTLPPLEPFGQGFKDMSPAVDEFERRLVGRKLVHNRHPVLTWNAASAVVMKDPTDNRKLTKQRSTGRIDGMIAALMATGRSIAPASEEKKPQIAFL